MIVEDLDTLLSAWSFNLDFSSENGATKKETLETTLGSISVFTLVTIDGIVQISRFYPKMVYSFLTTPTPWYIEYDIRIHEDLTVLEAIETIMRKDESEDSEQAFPPPIKPRDFDRTASHSLGELVEC